MQPCPQPCLPPLSPSCSSHAAVVLEDDDDQPSISSKRPRFSEEFTPQAIQLIFREQQPQPHQLQQQQHSLEHVFSNELLVHQLLREPLYPHTPHAVTPPMYENRSESVHVSPLLNELLRQLDCVFLEQVRFQCTDYQKQINCLYGSIRSILHLLTVQHTTTPFTCRV